MALAALAWSRSKTDSPVAHTSDPLLHHLCSQRHLPVSELYMATRSSPLRYAVLLHGHVYAHDASTHTHARNLGQAFRRVRYSISVHNRSSHGSHVEHLLLASRQASPRRRKWPRRPFVHNSTPARQPTPLRILRRALLLAYLARPAPIFPAQRKAHSSYACSILGTRYLLSNLHFVPNHWRLAGSILRLPPTTASAPCGLDGW